MTYKTNEPTIMSRIADAAVGILILYMLFGA